MRHYIRYSFQSEQEAAVGLSKSEFYPQSGRRLPHVYKEVV